MGLIKLNAAGVGIGLRVMSDSHAEKREYLNKW